MWIDAGKLMDYPAEILAMAFDFRDVEYYTGIQLFNKVSCGTIGKMEYKHFVVERQTDMKLREYKIVHLPKEQWENVAIPMRYTTEEYYDVNIKKDNNGFYVDLIKTKLAAPVSHYPEEYDFPDKLYQKHWQKAFAWGIVEEIDGQQGH